MVTVGSRGPLPKPNARRRNATVAMTELPAEGRTGAPPPWPMIADVVLTARRDLAAAKVEQLQDERRELQAEGKATGLLERRLDKALELQLISDRQLAAQRDLEAGLWADLWVLPQAVQWQALGWTRDVAQYVRHKVLGELGELEHAKEARVWSDRLGLNPTAMQRLRWQVVTDELGEARKAKTAPAKPRLRAVD